MSFHVPEKYRVFVGPQASSIEDGNNGAFILPPKIPGRELHVIASDGMGWEHVSVSLSKRRLIPTWLEMCFIKGVFWDPEDVVMQLHPRASQYVNMVPNCLHLWRPTDATIPEPPAFLVGIPGVELR